MGLKKKVPSSAENDLEAQRFISWEYQIKTVLKFCFVFLIAAIISFTIIYSRMAVSLLGKDYYSLLLTLEAKRGLLLSTVLLSISLQVIAGLLCTILVLLFVSHRIAGPFFRFEKVFESLSSGDLTIIIRLRKKDQMRSLAELLNKMIAGLRDKVRMVKSSFSRFDNDSERLKGAIEKVFPDTEVIEIVNDMDRSIQDLKKSLTGFEA